MEKIADSEDPNLDAIKRIVIEPASISEEVNAVTHHQVTSDEKNHIIKTLLALPVGSKARSNAMDALHAELMAKKIHLHCLKPTGTCGQNGVLRIASTLRLYDTHTRTHSHTRIIIMTVVYVKLCQRQNQQIREKNEGDREESSRMTLWNSWTTYTATG